MSKNIRDFRILSKHRLTIDLDAGRFWFVVSTMVSFNEVCVF